MAEKHSMGFLLCLGLIHLPKLGSCVWPAEDRRAVFKQGTSFYLLRIAKIQRCLVWTVPSLSRVMLPFSQPVPTSSAGDIPTPKHHKSFKSSEGLKIGAHPEFRKFSFHQTLSSITCLSLTASPHCAQTMAASCCVQLDSSPPVSASNALQLTLEETRQNPSYPRSNPWRAGLANGKQLQLLVLSQGSGL